MGIDSVRAALQIVTGAGELTRTKALEAAANLLAFPGLGPTAARATQAAGQVSNLADELVAAAAANREMVRSLVRQEMEAQMQRAGVATTGEVASLRAEVEQLKSQVETLREQRSADAPAAAGRSATARPAAKTAKKAPAKRAPAKKTATRTAVKKTAAKKAPAKRAPARKSAS